jgi:hypothetical protein
MTVNATLDDLFESPMEKPVPATDGGAAPFKCFREGACPRVMPLEFDNGLFQRIFGSSRICGER